MINLNQWHWPIKIITTIFINLTIALLIWVIAIKPTLIKQRKIQLALRQIKQQNAYIAKAQQVIQVANLPQYYCLSDSDIYAIAQANHLTHINKKTKLLSATADLNSLYYFLETLVLKQSPLFWQSLTIMAVASNNSYQLTLQWQPLKNKMAACRPRVKQSKLFFPNQPLDSLTVAGYFTTGNQTHLLVRDRSGQDNEIQHNDYVGAEQKTLEVVVPRSGCWTTTFSFKNVCKRK